MQTRREFFRNLVRVVGVGVVTPAVVSASPLPTPPSAMAEIPLFRQPVKTNMGVIPYLRHHGETVWTKQSEGTAWQEKGNAWIDKFQQTWGVRLGKEK